MKIVFLFFLLTTVAEASKIADAFKKKEYDRVVNMYKNYPDYAYSTKELIYISYALQKKGFYRQDIKLSNRIIRKRYPEENKKLVSSLQQGKTIDADEFRTPLKILYWNMLTAYGKIVEGYKEISELSEKDHKRVTMFSKILGELEFRESKVDKLSDKIQGHIEYLQKKIYKKSYSLSLQYVSWQSSAFLDGNGEITGLVITNKGLCAGGDAGIENYRWHFYVDGCFISGSGGISNQTGASVSYQQSNVPAYGLKFGPGASMIVSSSKSRIGLRLPIIYNLQKLSEPGDGYRVIQRSPISAALTLYSRWQFGDWYVTSEFGQYIQKEQTFWGLGIGKAF